MWIFRSSIWSYHAFLRDSRRTSPTAARESTTEAIKTIKITANYLLPRKKPIFHYYTINKNKNIVPFGTGEFDAGT